MAEYEKISHRIWDQLNSYSLPKWGFVVMRCTYGDDDSWAEFMKRLDAYIENHFRQNEDEIDAQVLIRHDWTVQEDPAVLDGASKDAVRQRFKEWLDTEGKAEYASPQCPSEDLIKYEIPRYSICIAVDKASMDSVLADPFTVFEGRILVGRDVYINVIRADNDWFRKQYPDFSTFDWTQYSEDVNEVLHYDQHETEVEGCRRYDVGWMKYRLLDLSLELWDQFSGRISQWDNIYVRPSRGLALRRGR